MPESIYSLPSPNSQSNTTTQSYNLNILPCKIQFNGVSKNLSTYFQIDNSEKDTDGSTVVSTYFRGRKLIAKETSSNISDNIHLQLLELNNNELVKTSNIDKIYNFGHEKQIPGNDCEVNRLQEWITVSDIIHE